MAYDDLTMPTKFETDDDRYAAVARRDASADGAFVYGVVTTGIYCRPVCGARLAKRTNMRFHATPSDAERDGFRACRRCRPDGTALRDRHDALIRAARERIDRNDNAPTLTELAKAAEMSSFHFQRLFKAIVGFSPKQYAIAIRATRVRDAVAHGQDVTQTIFDAGYETSSRFYDDARTFGLAPTDVRAGGAGLAMHAAVSATTLGAMLVAATERGVCAVLFGADEAALLDDLARRFPKARIIDAPPAFATWTHAIAAYVDRARGSLDVPLDVVGTAFQRRVWQALRAIAPGATATYSEIAERLDAPKAARAVARACAANPIAIAIPCHRVVRRDGHLGGYRWGLERKERLLDIERLALNARR